MEKKKCPECGGRGYAVSLLGGVERRRKCSRLTCLWIWNEKTRQPYPDDHWSKKPQ